MKNAKVLVVGGAGFVGSNLSHSLLKSDIASLTVVDNLLSATVENLLDSNQLNQPDYFKDSRLKFILGSISDDRVLLDLPKDYDYVFHLSTYHGNQSSICDPMADHDNNTLTTLKLCEHLKDSSNLKALVYAGAGCTVAKKTFDNVAPTDEDAGVSLYLDSPYQISKIIGEFYGNYYYMRYKLPFIKARFQNVYGPREILGAGQWRGTPATVWRNVVPSFIWQALNQQALTVENNGIATRDFIYVDDLVAGLIACASRGQAAEVYNLATGIETSIGDLANLINQITNNPTASDNLPAREWDRSGKRSGTTEKAEEKIGFKAKIDIKTGLEQTVAWTVENYDLIKAQILRHKFYLPELSRYEHSKSQKSESKKSELLPA
ncbi:MAG: NAD-dependent epimerase/dehydratase family protein [Gammaproteobacteria bacterium]|nr:NAD-dependent epimerase/dehydratase family protein [Gammaproteobacteria bacterium]